MEKHYHRIVLLMCAVVGDTSEIVVHEKQMAYAS